MNASVIVSTYNNRIVLERTLKSLLEQKFNGEHEIIVVNDGSSDGTKEFLEEFKKNKKNLRVFHQKNQGVCKARNKGITEAKYEKINTYLDGASVIKIIATANSR